MNLGRGANKIMSAVLMGLILVLALPTFSFAQGRGRGRGRESKSDKKFEKFVNGHDARDGRWDGRGPDWRRRSVFRDRRFERDWDDDDRFRNRRFRRDRDDFRFSRVRRIDFDGDGDFDRFDVLLQRRQARMDRWQRWDRRHDRSVRRWWR